jgi:hypothetical protein
MNVNSSASVVQKAILIENRKEKLDKLDEVLEEHNVGEKDSVAKALIFGNTKKGVDFLGNKLSEKLGESCITMHGDRSQEWVFVICLFILISFQNQIRNNEKLLSGLSLRATALSWSLRMWLLEDLIFPQLT